MEKHQVIDNDDAPELDDAFFARARPAREVMSEAAQASFKPRGRPKAAETKLAVSLRLDRHVVAFYKALGDGWQTRMNEDLLTMVTAREKVRTIRAKHRAD